jgi:hypothetical protein
MSVVTPLEPTRITISLPTPRTVTAHSLEPTGSITVSAPARRTFIAPAVVPCGPPVAVLATEPPRVVGPGPLVSGP